eukprot:1196298-Prorocentrum_minimum.AAC.5
MRGLRSDVVDMVSVVRVVNTMMCTGEGRPQGDALHGVAELDVRPHDGRLGVQDQGAAAAAGHQGAPEVHQVSHKGGPNKVLIGSK